MASMAQSVDAQQAMILVDRGTMVLTPTYYAFKMHVPFQDATALPVRLANNPRYTSGGIGIPSVSASAARARDGKLYLSLVNTNPKEAVAIAVALVGAVAKSATGSVLTAGAMDAHNSFAAPRAVMPMPLQARAERGRLSITLPAKSVAVVALHE
jgi:alpha-N-arabinofuranosidase